MLPRFEDKLTPELWRFSGKLRFWAVFLLSLQSLIVLINAHAQAQSYTLPAYVGKTAALHPVQQAGSDARVRQAAFDPATGAFTAPGRTIAVFAQP